VVEGADTSGAVASKKAATAAAAGLAPPGTGGAYADLTKIHRAQDEASLEVREAAFLEQVETLGLARESVNFRGVEQRHYSSSSVGGSPYAHLFKAGGATGATGGTGESEASWTQSQSQSQSQQQRQSTGAGAGAGASFSVFGVRNPMVAMGAAGGSMYQKNSEVGSPSIWNRQSEVELQTKGSFLVYYLLFKIGACYSHICSRIFVLDCT
jgi:hypothetical protein